MLLHRVITASILAAVVIWLMLFKSTDVFMYLLLVVAFLSGYEWSRLGGLRQRPVRIVFAIVVTLLPWLMTQYYLDHLLLYLFAVSLWWIVVFFRLRKIKPSDKSLTFSVGKLAAAIFIIPSAVVAMYIIHGAGDQGPEWLLYSLVLVWVADTGAYFAGKKYGKTKLAPSISPGKTREGLLGAIAATTIYTLFACYYFQLDPGQYLSLVLLSLVLTVISAVGDLYESFLKREAGLKDSGIILPGHGGMLDRIDGVLPAMPVFLIGFNWFLHPVGTFW